MHSYAQQSDFQCPQCGRSFRSEIWLIVDGGERPDLVERARAGGLHAVACPACGPLGTANAPLLLYFPDHDPATGQPPLLFSPPPDLPPGQEQQIAGRLLGMLARHLGDLWQDDWLAQVATVRRELLPAALSDDPAAALRAVQDASPQRTQRSAEEENGGEGEIGREGASINDLFLALFTVPDWDASRRIVEAHPELLADEAGAALAEIAQRVAGNVNDAAIVAEYRVLLRRCREVGIERAYAEKILDARGLAEAERLGLAPEEFLARARTEREIPPAVAALLAELAAEGIVLDSGEAVDRLLAERPDLRARVAAALEAGATPAYTAFDALLHARTWPEAQQVAETHPALFSDEADTLLGEAVAESTRTGNQPFAEHIARLRATLRRARDIGIAPAFAEGALRDDVRPIADALGLGPAELAAAMAGLNERMAPALRMVMDALAEEGVVVDSPEEMEAALAARPHLRERLVTTLLAGEAEPAGLPGSFGASGKVDDDPDPTNPDDLPATINRFLAAETWEESQRIVEAHPELLSDETDRRFTLALAEYADDPDAVQMLTVHRDLLRRCRTAGIARAFAEQMLGADALAEAERLGLPPEEYLANLRAMEQMPPALREVLAALSAEGAEIHSQEELERALATRPALRARLEQADTG